MSHAAAGRLTVTKDAAFDHESVSVHTVTVHVEDLAGLSEIEDLTVNIIDVNEKPLFSNAEIAISVAEESVSFILHIT